MGHTGKAFISYMLFIITMNGCSTPTEKEPEAVVAPPSYAPRLGDKQVFGRPFPELTPIFVDYIKEGKVEESRLGFQGWDFNNDGRFDLIEVLDESGRVKTRLYDFDSDGKVDHQAQVAGE